LFASKNADNWIPAFQISREVERAIEKILLWGRYEYFLELHNERFKLQ